MGEKQNQPFQLSFNASLRIDFQGSGVTSDGGLILARRIGNWSLRSLQQRLVKTGGRLLKHARYYWLLVAESQLRRRLFGAMVRRIELRPLPAG